MAEETEEKAAEETPEEAPKKTTRSKKSSVKKIAQECLDGKWGSGRERDLSLEKAGHNANEVRKEVYRLRGEELVK